MNSETNLVEFKRAKGGFPKKESRKTLSAFGNAEGGIIVFGVEEKVDKTLEVVGVSETADLQEKMTSISAEDMNVLLRLDYFLLEINKKTILAIHVPKCENHLRPYYIKELGFPNGAYVRDGNTDRKMTEEEMKNYVRNAQGDDFDGKCADNLIKGDLSITKIENFLKKSAKKVGRIFDSVDDALLKNIGVARECRGVLRPTIAGYLIFANQNPQNTLQFERYKIRCVRFKGSGVASDIIDKADVVGTLDEQIDLMESFVLRNIKNSAEIVGTKRVERYEYPKKAVREILANAVIHRDYRITETYTQVNIFDDRIEVFNPGNLPPGVTVENIKDAQESRNRIIAARLNEMDYLEEYGRGIDIVFTLMSEWGLLPPIFKNSSNSFKVILPGEKLSQLNERQIKIWEYLLENQKINRKDVEKILPDTPLQTINYDLRKMKDTGLIHQEGKSVSTYYEANF
ncbi:MAG: ATP-binding protein [Candidatus Moraniibacteriota bacterium]